tara:strand:+ start:555 stop:1928 length:1374 start_codon:yes stop_codon:yes gene_type:complete
MATFAKMSRAEWGKPVSGSRESRVDVFIDAIKAGDPVSDIEGKDVHIANTQKNIDAIKKYVADSTSGPTTTFDLKSGGTIVSNQIGKSPLFGGQGAGAGATGETAKFESLQCLYIAAVLGEGTTHDFSHYTIETLKKYKDKVFVSEPFDKYVAIDGSWHISGFKIAEKLIKAGYVTTKHTLHRGDKKMDSLYALKNKLRKAEGLPAINHDKWNPGDIWAMKDQATLSVKLNKIKTFGELNEFIVDNFMSRNVMGISLKKVKDRETVKLTDYNVEETALDKHKFTKVTLETAAGKGIFSSKNGMFFFDATSKADIRAPNSFGALNMELQGKGARGGRTGYAQIVYSAATHLNKTMPTNKELVSQARILAAPNPSKSNKDNFYNLVKEVNPEVDRATFEDGLSSKKGQAHFIHPLLGAAHLGAALMNARTSQRNDFTSEIVNVMGAKTNDSSAYTKASA